MACFISALYDTAPLRRLSITILLLLTWTTQLTAAAWKVDLVTVGPGDAVWEKFGHNMIRFYDPADGRDVCVNWGVFDFDQPNFILNFLRGRMLYTMDAGETGRYLAEYQAQDRRVTCQTLRLTAAQVEDLLRRCSENRKPGNAEYRYDYFKDNCSTRVRDMLDRTLGGALADATKGVRPAAAVTWRSEAVRLMQDDFWVSLGTDFALGPAGDKPLDEWAAGFLPASVSRSIAPFAEPPTEPWRSTRAAERATPPARWPGLLSVGVLGALMIGCARGGPRWALVWLWWAVSGLGGGFAAYMWIGTDHTAAYANQNLWCYSPLACAALLSSVTRRRGAAFGWAAATVGLTIVGCVVWAIGRTAGGPVAQANGGFILLALPLNIAAAYAARTALTNPPATDEVAHL